jgi:hypothetical protein
MPGPTPRYWELAPGLNNVGSYQVSGRPFAKGGIDASSATKVEFPTVTRWITIINNNASSVCKVGFSELGIAGDNYFTVQPKAAGAQSVSARLEVKVSEIWLHGSDDVDVVAGLTNIEPPSVRFQASGSGYTGPSWSGSAGVG